MTNERRLTERQQRFAEAYAGPAMGVGVTAARTAGYAGTDKALSVVAARLLGNIRVREAIAALSAKVRSGSIADVTECKEILTNIARNPKAEDKDRIAATDKLIKTHGGYLERHEVKHVGAKVVAYLPENGRART